MRISFKKVRMHHFMSFGDAEADLRNRGFCLVSGTNLDPRDSAKSNGSGKSTLFNAISYALTGETLQGLRSNLPNKEFGDGCWVRLDFDADGHSFSITRSRDDPSLGTSLSISVDGKDKSGKGIRESQAILSEMLPDVTSEILGSVIMLGQGMPMRFTANTPSGRKEVLEHLSKSDYMIQDLKDRISARAAALSEAKRRNDDASLVNSTKAAANAEALEAKEGALKALEEAEDPSERIKLAEGVDARLRANLREASESKASLEAEAKEANESLRAILEKRAEALQSIAEQHAEAKSQFAKEEATLSAKVASLASEIRKIESIRDVCPTCGQRIPDVVKPDASPLRSEKAKAEGSLRALREEIEDDEREYSKAKEGISAKYGGEVSAAEAKADGLSAKVRSAEALISRTRDGIEANSAELERARADLANRESSMAAAKAEIARLRNEGEALSAEAKRLADEASDISERSGIVSRLSTMAKRDFRGRLLDGIIEYVGRKAKEFSEAIFGTDGVGFALDGNDILISYCGKDYENLSGGERQRVDLIVQFALRDMMCSYLGFSSNILVLDEIADSLDSVSCAKVLDFVSSSLKDVESVFVVSHHADELDIPVDGEIRIVKDREGVSSIE